MKELPQERLLIADMAVAAAEAAYEMTREYVKERKAFGKTVADFQTTKHKMAEMKTEIAVGRAFVVSAMVTPTRYPTRYPTRAPGLARGSNSK